MRGCHPFVTDTVGQCSLPDEVSAICKMVHPVPLPMMEKKSAPEPALSAGFAGNVRLPALFTIGNAPVL